MIDGLPGIFYLYDCEWKMVRWNRKHELLTGFSADELKGKMVLDWFSEEFKGTIADTVRRVFQEGDATVEAPLTIKDGSQMPYLFKRVRLEIAGELYFWGMGIDISQRKANEEALLKSEQQLRAFLRKQDTNLQLLNLNSLIEDVLSVLNSDMVIHHVLVVKDFAADLPQVMGDDVQLKQVLINLIMNAQQAMEDSVSGVHRLVIRTSVSSTGKITVGIEDSGSGIEDGELEHIFEPFFTTRQEGTGMGLAISQFIIEAHRGQMWAENQAERGARICFSLPVAGGSPES